MKMMIRIMVINSTFITFIPDFRLIQKLPCNLPYKNCFPPFVCSLRQSNSKSLFCIKYIGLIMCENKTISHLAKIKTGTFLRHLRAKRGQHKLKLCLHSKSTYSRPWGDTDSESVWSHARRSLSSTSFQLCRTDNCRYRWLFDIFPCVWVA